MKKNFKFLLNTRERKNDFIIFAGVLFSLIVAFFPEYLLIGATYSEEYLKSIGRMSIIFVGTFSIYGIFVKLLSKNELKFKNFFTILCILLLSVVILKFSQISRDSLLSELSSINDKSKISKESLNLAFPLAMGALLIQSVMSMKLATMYAFMWSLIVTVYFKDSPILYTYALSSSLVAISGTVKFRSRGAYIKAGLNIAILSIPFSLMISFFTANFSYLDLLVRLICGFLGGLLCYLIASGLTPIVEHLGRYVTDMRLMEIATLDHPLLKELSLQAPGTWNHSMVMGMMGEMASSLVGANPVLLKTGAYFHDIGKISKTMYFVENQGGGENPHDKLTPSMSALIIKSHVKEGVELAAKYKLPVPIIDMIQQHHGTSLIEYFYNKAVKCKKDNDEEIDELLYCYLGPKPQSKEAGILMLSDCIEAAVRALPEHSKDKIQVLVQKMINKIFAAGQLDECDLTLKDLHQIADSFVKTLTAIYHQRIAYTDIKDNPNNSLF